MFIAIINIYGFYAEFLEHARKSVYYENQNRCGYLEIDSVVKYRQLCLNPDSFFPRWHCGYNYAHTHKQHN